MSLIRSNYSGYEKNFTAVLVADVWRELRCAIVRTAIWCEYAWFALSRRLGRGNIGNTVSKYVVNLNFDEIFVYIYFVINFFFSFSSYVCSVVAVAKESKIDDLLNQLRFKQPGRELTKLIPLENLSVENTLYWHSLVVYIQKTDALEERHEDVICDLTAYCEYVARSVKILFHCFFII